MELAQHPTDPSEAPASAWVAELSWPWKVPWKFGGVAGWIAASRANSSFSIPSNTILGTKSPGKPVATGKGAGGWSSCSTCREIPGSASWDIRESSSSTRRKKNKIKKKSQNPGGGNKIWPIFISWTDYRWILDSPEKSKFSRPNVTCHVRKDVVFHPEV